MKTLVLLEDDPAQSDWLTVVLGDAFPGASIELITSEYEFRAQMDAFKKSNPDVFVLDVMVRWTKPSPTLEDVPEDVKVNGYYRAGMRCAKLLREQGINAPIVLYTILERDDLRADIEVLEKAQIKDVYYVRKESDIHELVKRIRTAVPEVP